MKDKEARSLTCLISEHILHMTAGRSSSTTGIQDFFGDFDKLKALSMLNDLGIEKGSD